MKRVLCSISERCHLGEAWLSGKGDGTHTLSLIPGWDSMTHVDSPGLGLRFVQKGAQGTNDECLRCQNEPELPSREYGFMFVRALGRNSKRSYWLGTFSALTHTALYFANSWMFVFFLRVKRKQMHTEPYLVIICIPECFRVLKIFNEWVRTHFQPTPYPSVSQPIVWIQIPWETGMCTLK